MGLMPPYDPFRDTSLAWVVARVESIAPARPSWGNPAALVLVIEEVLRGQVPERVSVSFGPPREAGDEQFYMTRGLGPPPWTPEQEAQLAHQRAQMDARPVEVPAVGERIIVWLTNVLPLGWDVPTLRTIGAATRVPMRSRWIEAAHLDAVRTILRG